MLNIIALKLAFNQRLRICLAKMITNISYKGTKMPCVFTDNSHYEMINFKPIQHAAESTTKCKCHINFRNKAKLLSHVLNPNKKSKQKQQQQQHQEQQQQQQQQEQHRDLDVHHVQEDEDVRFKSFRAPSTRSSASGSASKSKISPSKTIKKVAEKKQAMYDLSSSSESEPDLSDDDANYVPVKKKRKRFTE